MFDDGNPVVSRAARARGVGRGALRIWSWPRTAKVAMDDALCGFWAGDWLAIGYFLQLASPSLVFALSHPLAAGRGLGVAPHLPPLVSLTLVAAAVVLEQVIKRRQARVAAIALLLWTLLEVAGSALPWLSHDVDLALIPNIACLVLAGRSVAGSIALARLRRQAPVEVFS